MSVLIDLDAAYVDGRLVGNEIHTAFTLFFLELERNASDRTALNALHQVLHKLLGVIVRFTVVENINNVSFYRDCTLYNAHD